MTRMLLFFGCSAMMTLPSCSQQQITDFENKAEYIARFEGLSNDKLITQAQADAALLQALIDSIGSLEFYYSFSFGGATSEGRMMEADTATEFRLPDRRAIEADFLNPDRKLYFEQRVTLPESEFDFSPGYDKEGFQYVKSKNIRYNVEEIYRDNRIISPADVKLRNVDSVRVHATYRFPVGFDTLAIPVNQKDSVLYDGMAIQINMLNHRRAELTLPITLAALVIGNHGVTQDGALVENNSYSSFPIVGIDTDKLAEVKALQQLLENATEETILHKINSVSDSVFRFINQMAEIQHAYNAWGHEADEDVSEQIKTLNEWTEKYTSILGVTKMTYEIAFPQDVDNVHLYIANAFDGISTTFMAENEVPHGKYTVFYDREKNKYGIADTLGQIIIPATYQTLRDNDWGYFTELDGRRQTSYFLDSANKKMVAFPENLTFRRALDDDLAVFEDTLRYEGVMDKRQREIVPFQYDAVELVGDVIAVTATKRGRKFHLFYTREGKQVPTPEKIVSYEPLRESIVVGTREQFNGLISGKGELILPLAYHIKARLTDQLYAFRYPENSDEKLGILNAETGEVVLPPELGYLYIESFFDGMAVVQAPHEKGGRWGFIDETGTIKISPIFDYVTDFREGHAVVKAKDGHLYLIDKNGNMVKGFPGPDTDRYSSYVYLRELGGMTYYEINESYYDFQGNPVDKTALEALKKEKARNE